MEFQEYLWHNNVASTVDPTPDGNYYYDVWRTPQKGETTILLHREVLTKAQYEAWNGTAPTFYRNKAKNIITKAYIEGKHKE